MKLRTNHTPLLLLLAPSLATALASPAAAQSDPDSLVASSGDSADSIGSINVEPRHGVPTRDAPVDGKDGKPHLGPFVESPASGSAERELPPLHGRPDDPNVVDGQRIPETNDGVMFDKNRERPLEGTTGTEGGVSEKDRERKDQETKAGGKLQTQPEAPKEQPPLPHSDELKIQSNDKVRDPIKPGTAGSEDSDSYTGLDKPDDLPEKTQQNPPPLPNSANKDHLEVGGSTPGQKINPQPIGDDDEGIIQPFHSFILSFTMILVSEVGDKTFLVAALMAMKHDRMVVFSAAFGALLVMTILSAVLGHTVPTLIPKRLTSFLASVLFFVFGAKLLREGLQMDPNEGVGAEMHEVEQELAEKEKELGRYGGNSSDPYVLEMGMGGRRSRSRGRFPSPPRSPSQSPTRSPSRGSGSLLSSIQGLSNLCSLLLSPAWVQTFVMTFLGEWGDRSQIATIAMAAGQDYWWVTLGAMAGHAICTGAAVLGGRAIAGRVSLKVVTVGGAVAFLIFGVIYFVESFYA